MKTVFKVYAHLRNLVGKTTFHDGYDGTENMHLVNTEIRKRIDNARDTFVPETPNF
jgi:hypothetical protein